MRLAQIGGQCLCAYRKPGVGGTTSAMHLCMMQGPVRAMTGDWIKQATALLPLHGIYMLGLRELA